MNKSIYKKFDEQKVGQRRYQWLDIHKRWIHRYTVKKLNQDLQS